MTQQSCYIGIDVAKDSLDVATIPADESASIPYTEAEVTALIKRFKKLDATLIVVEATGGYEMELVAALAAKALPVTVVNPRQAQDTLIRKLQCKIMRHVAPAQAHQLILRLAAGFFPVIRA